MGCGIRPATPGTVVVLAAMVLLILVSVSVPLLKSIYFLRANVADYEITLGTWGVCTPQQCSKATLGYDLDLEQLFGFDGLAGIDLTEQVPDAIVKWLTYVLILHPAAAVAAAVSALLGILAHIRGFSGTCLTTTFASLAATISFIAFAFDCGLFYVAKARIESSGVGGTAEIGAALWMTLAAAILLAVSGCFFGCGNRIVSDHKHSREQSEKTRPLPDIEHGARMRQGAFDTKTGKDGSLPIFPDRYGDPDPAHAESIPLTAVHAQHGNSADEDWDGYNDTSYSTQQGHYQQAQYPGGFVPANTMRRDDGSVVEGVGAGYGRRYNRPASPTATTGSSADRDNLGVDAMGGITPSRSPGPYGPAVAAGAGSRLAAEARAQRGLPPASRDISSSSMTVQPFTGMYESQPTSPINAAPAPLDQSAQYTSAKTLDSYGTAYEQQPAAPQPQHQQQQYYAQNPSPPSIMSHGPAPSYVTHQPTGASYGQQYQYPQQQQGGYDSQYQQPPQQQYQGGYDQYQTRY